MATTRRKPMPSTKTQERSTFEVRWSVTRFPNQNIARDLEPHERTERKREAEELGIDLTA